jgi:hypothetical protein
LTAGSGERLGVGNFAGSSRVTSWIMSFFRTTLGVICVGAAAPCTLAGQVGTSAASPETPSVFRGIAVQYGAILPGGLTLHRQLLGGPAEANWATLSVAASITKELAIGFSSNKRELIPHLGFSLSARADLFDDMRFYGLGGRLGDEPIRFEQNRYSLAPTFTFGSSNIRVDFGPVLKYTLSRFDLDDAPSPPGLTNDSGADMSASSGLAQPYGFGGFGQLGAQAEMTLAGPILGSTVGHAAVTLGGSAFPAMLDVVQAFTEVHSEIRGALALHVPGSPFLGVRGGVKKVWGAVPIHEAAVLGGGSSFRGVPSGGLMGDASVYGGAELRLTTGSITVMNRKMRYGLLGVADVGRAFYNGASSHGWLADVGGGLWLEPAGFGKVLAVGVTRGPLGTRFFLSAGM